MFTVVTEMVCVFYDKGLKYLSILNKL